MNFPEELRIFAHVLRGIAANCFPKRTVENRGGMIDPTGNGLVVVEEIFSPERPKLRRAIKVRLPTMDFADGVGKPPGQIHVVIIPDGQPIPLGFLNRGISLFAEGGKSPRGIDDADVSVFPAKDLSWAIIEQD